MKPVKMIFIGLLGLMASYSQLGAFGDRPFFTGDDYRTFVKNPLNVNESMIVATDMHPNNFPTPEFVSEGEVNVSWINENPEALRSTKFHFSIVDFVRGPTVTTITVDTEAKLNYQECDKDRANKSR